MTPEEQREIQKAIILDKKEDEEMKKVAVIILFFVFGSTWLFIPLYTMFMIGILLMELTGMW